MLRQPALGDWQVLIHLLGDFLSLGWIQAGLPSGPRLTPLAPWHQNATPPRMEDSKVTGSRRAAHLSPRGCDSPGGPDDGNAVSGIDGEGQGPREVAGLLNQIVFSTPGHRGLEVCIERIAVQLHQIQDGCCQGFYHLLCEGRGQRGNSIRTRQGPFCCRDTRHIGPLGTVIPKCQPISNSCDKAYPSAEKKERCRSMPEHLFHQEMPSFKCGPILYRYLM